MPLLANLLVVVYALDGCLSLLEAVLRAGTGSQALLGLRNAFASFVLCTGIAYVPLLVLAPRLPTVTLLLLVLSLVWLNFSAVPLPLLIDSLLALGFASVFFQLSFAVLAFLWIRRCNGGRGWLWTDSALKGPALSWKHSMAVIAGCVVVLVPAGVLYGIVYALTAIQLSTQGFVSFDLLGVSLADRRYEREDREIRLVGMMHIGEEDNYRRVVQSFIEESTIVLAEGMTDEGVVLETPLSYERFAAILGLEQQRFLADYLGEAYGEDPSGWPVIQHADLDLGELSPDTQEFLERIGRALNSDRMVPAMQQMIADYADRPEVLRTIEHDIIHLRNQHLLDEMTLALEDYQRVVVPWGALHLPYIEEAITGWGFEPANSTRHRLISWRGILEALVGGE